MLRLFIVRHGETLFNVAHRVQGWCDSPLTAEGIRQARGLAAGLKDISFTAAFTSTSERTVDTAHILLEGRDVPLHYSKNWKEFNFGTFEGEKEADVFGPRMNEGLDVFRMFGEYGGDTSETLFARLLRGLEEIRRACPDGNVLVVSHGGAILTLIIGLAREMGMEIFDADDREEPKGVENCSVTTVVYDGGWKVEKANDTSYRDRGISTAAD